GGKFAVVIADNGDSLGHGKAEIARGGKGSARHDVVVAEHGVGPVSTLQQGAGGGIASGMAPVAGNFRYRYQPGGTKGTTKTGLAFDAGEWPGIAGTRGEPPATEADEVIGRQRPAMPLGGQDGAAAAIGTAAIEQHVA